ncbi:uncharacterized protein LOC112141317 [Oryzias melastigma]|uniref:uncharacterized protein LOC112141317 n=1 Tax=Oryzias melastigma TaxID=30732 RepID=UPI000CF7DE51|nr:uncharacterized protein LOC112141317 [Oryzias melastigma]
MAEKDGSVVERQSELADIVSTAHNLVSLLRSRLRQGNPVEPAEGQGAQGETSRQIEPVGHGPRGISPGQSIHQEMARSLPGLFRREGKGKRRFAPYANRQKSFFVTFFLLDKQRFKTLKGDEELALTLAGLGKRSLTVSESTTHSELTELLIKAYPKLGSICGGWLLHKSTGGGGQRKLVVIPPDSDGYNGQQLKGVSGSGKCTLYIAPLQEQIDTTPLPPEAKEFESMPKALCTTCGKMIPLQVLPLHIKNCKEENLCSSSEESRNQDHIFPSCHEDVTETTAQCPVCSGSFNIDIIESHASECGLRTSHAASETSSKNSDLSFKCMEEILSWIGDQVKEDDTFSICVSRSDLFDRGMQQWQRQKKSSPKNKLKVSFFGETGLDTRVLTKEFLTEMVAEIEKRLFMGGMDKNGKILATASTIWTKTTSGVLEKF